MKKHIRKLLLLTSVLLCACTPIFPKTVEVPSGAHLKNNWDVSVGNLAICHDNKVYYYSDENNVPGIYSMDEDGYNSRILLECDDIKKMQIKDQKLYYLQRKGSVKDSLLITETYELMQFDLETQEKQKIELSDIQGSYYGTWDFFIGDVGTIFNDLSYFSAVQKLFLETGIKQLNGRFVGNIHSLGNADVIDTIKDVFYLYDFGDVYCIGDRSLEKPGNNRPYMTVYGSVGLFDKQENEKIFDFQPNVSGVKTKPNILYQDGDILFIVSGDGLTCYNNVEKKIIAEYQIPDMCVMKNAAGDNHKLLIIGMTTSGMDRIISFDMETGEIQTVFTGDENSMVVYFDSEKYVLMENKRVKEVILDNAGNMNEGKEVSIKIDLKSGNYKTDVAGNWLFITHWDKRNKCRKLDYKINLKNFTVGNLRSH